MGNVSGFGIGTYQSISGGTTVGSGFPTAPYQLAHPYAGVFGGSYGYVLDTTIKAPTTVTWTPIPEIGIDGVGTSVTRGFSQMTWTYGIMRPDMFYKLQFLRAQSAKAPPGFQYLVLLQFPDVLGSGILAQQLARFDPITVAERIVSVFYSVQLHFSYIGEAALLIGTPISVLS
jgi:hypothetical protein